ncbi:hypothetical protein RGU12_19460 [Fredinandcohnia sp. QZ13]|uniref:hypothetical protein n=1 Tax=Fredinandcohnia sp. QZ13 TaxID=3073144 RepID=UPI0028530B5C|nr:hypothetical protein [Fredinandcohnia sp. QZ13]MDR4889675.1 hypothetical protein [Fredinandcohnia sp. QZ13]
MTVLNWPKLFAFAAFLFIIYTIFDNVQEHQVFLYKAEHNQVEERVWRKFVVNDLLVGPRFSVQIGTLPESSIPTKHNDAMVIISQELFEKVNAGDTIPGYKVNGKFYTETLLKEEVKWFYILLTVFSLYPISYILYWLFKIKIIWKWFAAISRRLYLDKIASFVISFLIFGVLIGTLLFFLSSDTKSAIENGYEKYFGKNHAETTALIMEHGFDRRTSTYNRTDYYISMMYKPENHDSIFIVKGVTWHTYNKYQEKMPIVYNVDNPYQVYAKEMDIADYLDILMTETVFLTLISIILIVLLSSIPFLLWKQKKRKS